MRTRDLAIVPTHPSGFGFGLARYLHKQPTTINDECSMDAALKELSKLERLTADGKAKSPPIDRTLDALLATLRAEREKVQSGDASAGTFEGLAAKVESLKKDLDERQKEIYNSISRYGKALDKVRSLHPLRPIGNGPTPRRNSPILYQLSTRCLPPPTHPRHWTAQLLCTFSEPASSRPLKHSSGCVFPLYPAHPIFTLV